MATDDPLLRFLPRGDNTRLYEGIVHGEAGQGSFLGPNETYAAQPLEKLIDHQPAAFQPRLRWDHLHFLDEDKQPELKDDAEASIRFWANNVCPPDDFGLVSNESWDQHCADLWRLLGHMQARQRPLENYGLTALLRMLCYGLADVIVPCRSNMYFSTTTIYENGPELKTMPSPRPCHDHLLPDGYSIADAVHCIGYSPQKFREATYNKRFFIGHAQFACDNHWVFYAWDRVAGQLTAYDSLSHGRRERCQALAVAWRQLLAELGLPFDFAVYSMPLSDQADAADSAVVGVFAFFINLRGLVGLTRQDMIGYIPILKISFDDDFPTAVPPLALRHRDWKLEPSIHCRASESDDIDTQRAYHFIGAAILDELGIPGRWFKVKGVTTKLIGSDLAHYAQYSESQIVPKAHIFTSFGGYNPIRWKGNFISNLYKDHRIVQIPKNGRFASLYRFSRKISHKRPQIWLHLPDTIVHSFTSRGFRFENGCPVHISPPVVKSILGTAVTPPEIRDLMYGEESLSL